MIKKNIHINIHAFTTYCITSKTNINACVNNEIEITV